MDDARAQELAGIADGLLARIGKNVTASNLIGLGVDEILALGHRIKELAPAPELLPSIVQARTDARR